MNFDADDLLELEEYFKQNNLDKEKVCLVGSSTLSLLGIRNHNDIDIIIHSSFNFSLSSHSLIEQVKSPWSTLHSDDEIIENSNYHIIFNGYKFVIPEFVYHRKVWHNRIKDILDIRDLEDYSKMCKDWNWNLIMHNLPKKSIFHKIRHRFIQLNNQFQKYLRNNNYLHNDSYQVIPTNFLLSKQIINDEFNRYDLIVRYKAIHDFLNGKSIGIDLYKKMQDKRSGSDYRYPWKFFKSLINNFHSIGYDTNFPILVNNDLHIVDGAHRVACSIYFNIPFIPININKRLNYSIYNLDWFHENSFSDFEISELKKDKEKIFLDNNLYFTIILWPSVFKYFDDIQQSISDQFYILDYLDYNNVKNFDEFVRQLYAIDDIKEWKIDMKIEGFVNYKKNIRVIKVFIEEPDFRKKDNGKYISKKVENLKVQIRNKYSVNIPNYFHDIVIHVGDNYDHTKKISNLKIVV